MEKPVSKDIVSKLSEAERNNSETKIMDDEYDYDPYDHSDKENATSYSQSLIVLLKASLGTGVLAMPRSFYNAGYLVGFIGTILIGILATCTIHMIVSAEYVLCRRKRIPNMSYQDTMEAAFEYGPKGVRKYKKIAWYTCYIFLIILQLGTSCIYLVFIADNLKDEIEIFFGPIEIRTVIIYLLVPLILISLVRNIKFLSPLSSLGHLFTAICFCIIFYYIFQDIPSFADRRPVGTIKTIPLFFGTVLFTMETIGSVMPVKNEMSEPQFFASTFGVLNMSMFPTVTLYAFIGLFGYLQYGDAVKGSVTLNMPQHNVFGHAVKLLLASSIYIVYAISNYMVYVLIWRNLIDHRCEKSPHRLKYEYIVRISIVLATFVFAVAIPNLELFIAFLGSLCLPNVGLFFPVVLQTLTCWDYYSGPRFYMFIAKNLAITGIAVLGFVVGVSRSSYDIYNTVIVPSIS